jgi:catechol 2,3-dioxygenase-like lactoylglutathione lyase family enzyme
MVDLGLTHIALPVTDLEASTAFYSRYAGMEVVHRRRDPESGGEVVWISDRTRPFEAFLDAHGLLDALTRFIVPAGEVRRLRDQLDIVTIDERRLFPDLDGVAAQMRRYYS